MNSIALNTITAREIPDVFSTSVFSNAYEHRLRECGPFFLVRREIPDVFSTSVFSNAYEHRSANAAHFFWCEEALLKMHTLHGENSIRIDCPAL